MKILAIDVGKRKAVGCAGCAWGTATHRRRFRNTGSGNAGPSPATDDATTSDDQLRLRNRLRMRGRLRIVWCSSMTNDTHTTPADASHDASNREPIDQTMGIVFDTDVLCPECSYNLRGLTSEFCPECGRSVEQFRLGVSQIPWVHRAEMGRCKAYWKTVMFVMTTTRRFSAEVAHPVSYSDAQKFRWLTVLHAFLPILVATVVVDSFIAARSWSSSHADPAMPGFVMSPPPWYVLAYQEAWPIVLSSAGVLLYLIAATGVPSYFFHPRDFPVHVQDRAVAASYYAPAALAWTFIPAALVIVAVSPIGSAYGIWKVASLLTVVIALVLHALILFKNVLTMLACTISGRPQRIWFTAAMLPLTLLCMAALIIPSLHAFEFAVLVAIESFA